jgi:hypothetical protein
MPSFDLVNYSLRPNKAIQRHLVFEAVRILQDRLDLTNLIYVGLGSIWFTDFQIAHKFLRINDMISMEEDDVGYRRARFNQPFKTIQVLKGSSSVLLPKLLARKKLNKRPWFIWLDYDKSIDEEKISDIRRVIESAPANTILSVTLPVFGRTIGRPLNRPDRLRKIFGSVVPDELDKDDCNDENLTKTLLSLIENFMASCAATVSRPGGFVPAFRIAYRDTTPMLTVGGVLPTKGALGTLHNAVSDAGWPAVCARPVETPPLTLREAAVFQSQLPRQTAFTRKNIRKLGFDLEVGHLRSFERYYRYYTIFAQISM